MVKNKERKGKAVFLLRKFIPKLKKEVKIMRYFLFTLMALFISGSVFAQDVHMDFDINSPWEINVPYVDYPSNPSERDIARVNTYLTVPYPSLSFVMEVEVDDEVELGLMEIIFRDQVVATIYGVEDERIRYYEVENLALNLDPVPDVFFTIVFRPQYINVESLYDYMEVRVTEIEIEDSETGEIWNQNDIVHSVAVYQAYVDLVVNENNSNYGSKYIYLLPGEQFDYFFRAESYDASQIVSMEYVCPIWTFQAWDELYFYPPDITMLEYYGYVEDRSDLITSYITWVTDYSLGTQDLLLGGFQIFNNSLPVGEHGDAIFNVELGCIDNQNVPHLRQFSASLIIETVDGVIGDVNGNGYHDPMDFFWIQYVETYRLWAYWNQHTPPGRINLNLGGLVFSWATTLLDAGILNLPPGHPLLDFFGVGQLRSEFYGGSVRQSASFETTINGQDLIVETEGDAVLVTAVLSDGSLWQKAAWTDRGPAVFNNVPPEVSEGAFQIEAVSFAGFPGSGDIPVIESVPTQFALKQNYPNPFNPTTTIEFTLFESNVVNLSIYNLMGQKVVTLIDDNLSVGNHSVVFDGSNLSSGVYFSVIQAGKSSDAKMMTLVK